MCEWLSPVPVPAVCIVNVGMCRWLFLFPSLSFFSSFQCRCRRWDVPTTRTPVIRLCNRCEFPHTRQSPVDARATLLYPVLRVFLFCSFFFFETEDNKTNFFIFISTLLSLRYPIRRIDDQSKPIFFLFFLFLFYCFFFCLFRGILCSRLMILPVPM